MAAEGFYVEQRRRHKVILLDLHGEIEELWTRDRKVNEARQEKRL